MSQCFKCLYSKPLLLVSMLEGTNQVMPGVQGTNCTYITSRQLTEARKGVSHGGLGLLAKHRRRERLRALLDILRTLKTLVSLHYIVLALNCLLCSNVLMQD